MLELPHTVIGATIASQIPDPRIALPLALASHFLADFIPHWNPRLYEETKKYGQPQKRSNQIIILDVILSLTAGFFLASRFLPNIQRSLIIVVACFLAVLPDLVEGPYFYLGVKSKFLEKAIEWQHDHQAQAKPTLGLISQLATILICLAIIFL